MEILFLVGLIVAFFCYKAIIRHIKELSERIYSLEQLSRALTEMVSRQGVPLGVPEDEKAADEDPEHVERTDGEPASTYVVPDEATAAIAAHAAKNLTDEPAMTGISSVKEIVLSFNAIPHRSSPASADNFVDPETIMEPDSGTRSGSADPMEDSWLTASDERGAILPELHAETADDAACSPEPPYSPSAAQVDGSSYLKLIVHFIRGGNIWVAGGVIMLLLGFGFLAQLGIFPVEARIAGAALAGMGMVGGGVYLRHKRPMYALILQGGGVGVLYLSAFASAKLTTLLPPVAALIIMIALIIPAVTLALLQNAQVLALFSFVGGFAAPILLSDGSGNYVALFTCYGLLNLGILAISRFRHWRWLNLAGALCTFLVSGYWGITSYDASMFWTVEPYLLGFVFIYIAVTLMAVKRGEFSYAEPLDVTLACSMPFVAALFQWRLAVDIPHGLSVSAVAFGAFFILLAFGVWRVFGTEMRRLAELYLANGVVLANLAIPLELSGNVTATAWAVEGAILFLFACRVGSARIKVVALVLHLVSMIAFLWDLGDPARHTLLSTVLISLALLASAGFHKKNVDDPRRETLEAVNAWLGIGLERVLAVLGLAWWYGGLALETARFAEQPLVMFFLVASASSAVWYFAEKVTGLKDFLKAAILVPLATAACCLLLFGAFSPLVGHDLYLWRLLDFHFSWVLRHNFLSGWSALAWIVFLLTQTGMLLLCRWRVTTAFHAWWAGIFVLEALLMLTSSGRGAALEFGFSRAWGSLAGIIPALLYVFALTRLLKRYAAGRSGSFSPDHARILGGAIPAILFVPLGIWLCFSFFSQGRYAPLPFYVPLLNPLELRQALCIAMFALWQKTIHDTGGIRFALGPRRLLLALDGLIFLWLHSMLFRAIFYFTGTPMNRAWEHESFQVLLTILWGAWGMSHIILGNRTRIRLIWVIGASLMIADTAKLFLVDLADKGTLFRVLSFFVMGIIFLLIGWLAPLPPSNQDAHETREKTSDGDMAG